MQDLDIIERVYGTSEWVNSFVLVKKSDGKLRLCLDPRELNKVIIAQPYKLPNIDEISNELKDSRYFSTLDASNAFWNIPLDSESSKLCTFGTPLGRYRFKRLPYGIKTASEVFQEYFQEIFEMKGVKVYIDDILIHAETKIEHDKILEKVFKLASKYNIKFNKQKCKFGLNEITYLGHKFNKNGIQMDDEKIQAIKDIEVPKNKKELQQFLGLITYVGRFIPDLSDKTYPLRQLIKDKNEFIWQEVQEKAFNKLKNIISREPVLKYFDPLKHVTISVDASKNGLGAVLLQDDQPCAYVSRAMTPTQENYAQIEKELLAICFGINKFYQYVYGSKFTVETDHKPLTAIFQKPLNNCPARLQKMLLTLQKYDINLVYKPGRKLIIADHLSRNYSKIQYKDNLDLEAQVCLIEKNYFIKNNNY